MELYRPRVSIIMPSLNVAPFIRQCMKTCVTTDAQVFSFLQRSKQFSPGLNLLFTRLLYIIFLKCSIVLIKPSLN